MSAISRTTSFKPSIELLEERSLMNGASMSQAPVSPLTDAAVWVLQKAYVNDIAMRDLPSVAAKYHLEWQVPAAVGYVLQTERNLQNTMRLLEQYEGYYERLGYDGSTFRLVDYYFRQYDQDVMNYAVTDMQLYHSWCTPVR
jgi:hypothetical protein